MKGKLLENISENDNFYFVHSYYAEIGESTTSVCDYITPFSATLEKTISMQLNFTQKNLETLVLNY